MSVCFLFPIGRIIRNRACALRDTSHAIIAAELDPEFEKLCEEVIEARKRRGEADQTDAPSFYFTKPLDDTMRNQLGITAKNYPERFSHRTRGMEAENDIPERDGGGDGDEVRTTCKKNKISEPALRQVIKRIPIPRKPSGGKNISPWCKPTRRLYRRVVVYVDMYGNEVNLDNNEDENVDIDDNAVKPNKDPKEVESEVKDTEVELEAVKEDTSNEDKETVKKGSPVAKSKTDEKESDNVEEKETARKSPRSASNTKSKDSKDVDMVSDGEERSRRRSRSSTHTSPVGRPGRKHNSPGSSTSPRGRPAQVPIENGPQTSSPEVASSTTDQSTAADGSHSPRDMTRRSNKVRCISQIRYYVGLSKYLVLLGTLNFKIE